MQDDVQDKMWLHGPDAEAWETYTVLADADVMRAADDACGGPADGAVIAAPSRGCSRHARGFTYRGA